MPQARPPFHLPPLKPRAPTGKSVEVDNSVHGAQANLATLRFPNRLPVDTVLDVWVKQADGRHTDQHRRIVTSCRPCPGGDFHIATRGAGAWPWGVLVVENATWDALRSVVEEDTHPGLQRAQLVERLLRAFIAGIEATR